MKKSELYSSLWKSCDELRGGMDASQYKDYVLVLLFMKYVSDKAAAQENYLLVIPKGGGFADMAALKGNKEIGDKINKIIAKLAEKNELKGVIDVADFNDSDKLGRGKEMVDRLSRLVAIFEGLDFGKNRAEGDDLLGDAYEYLMRHFATESGKSKGQFYTPAEVSRIMAKVIGLGSAKSQQQTIYDPACGSGSLLIKAHDEAKSQTGHDLAIYGQEMDNATRALARMNTILHDCPTAEVEQGNTLADPHFRKRDGLETFDFVVANPPFSTKAWSSGFNPAEDQFRRFPYGLPPARNGDYAFLLHILASLKSGGKGACILPHGVLFRGGAEAVIRREIVKRGFIKGIIGLPANLFYGTSIPACIMVLDKEHAAARKGIFMVDASKGFRKDGNKNRLRAQDMHRIVDAFTRQLEVPGYARMVPLAEISDPKNDLNLNLPRYIDGSEAEDLQDIDAHLRGGIPDRDLDSLEQYWKVFPTIREVLFEPGGRPGYSRLRIPDKDIKMTILRHSEVVEFSGRVAAIFEKWKKANVPRLLAIKRGDAPKALIELLSEELLRSFGKAPLLDPYDVYQRLMDYWDDMMQDDVYLLVQEGWKAILDGKPNTDLIPTWLVSRRYFPKEEGVVEQLESKRDAIARRLEELDEEHAGEEGLLADARTDKGKLSRASVKARLSEIKNDIDAADERELLEECLGLIDAEAAASRKVKDAEKVLEAQVLAKYSKLSVEEMQTLVIHHKWLGDLGTEVQSELDQVSQALTGRIRELAERYATALPALVSEVETLSARVDEHLRKMGAVWN